MGPRPGYRVTLVFVALFVLCFLIGLSGYGNDNDTARMIRSGQGVFLEAAYHPSRTPGYLVPELSIGLASLLGGFALSNLVSAVLGTLTLAVFFSLLRRYFGDADALLLTLAVGLNPYFLIASSSSMDYVYSLFFGVAGTALLAHRKHFLAGALFALAISSRLSNILIILGIYAYLAAASRAKPHNAGRPLLSLVVSLSVALFAAAILYVPVFVASSCSLSFLSYVIGGWTVLEHLYRFVYKNLYLFGLLPSLLIIISTVCLAQKAEPIRRASVLFGLGIVAVHEVLFFRVPLEISYLLPLLFIVVPTWALVVGTNRRALIALLVGLTALYNIVNIDVLNKTYNASGSEVVSGSVRLAIKPGVLIDDLSRRQR